MRTGRAHDAPVGGAAAPAPGWWARRSARVRVLLAAGGVAAVAVVGGGTWLWFQVDPPGRAGAPVAIAIPRGATKGEIADLLEEKGVVASATVFRLYIRVVGAGEFRAGLYRRGELRRSMAMGDAVAALEAGPRIVYRRLTIPEGLTLRQVAARVGRLPGRSAQRFLALATSGRIRSRFQPPDVSTLEGLVFPDTYLVAEDEDERTILRRMVRLFEQVAGEVGLEQEASRLGLTPYEAVVLASLVEEEAKVAEERPLVAAVLHNRLRRGMLLQVDATVLYALGRHKDRVLLRDLEVDSPYNTYLHPGLPPTPIAAPGEAALRAALAPADVDYLYYVKIDEDGRHAFASTSEEHARNVAQARRRGVLR